MLSREQLESLKHEIGSDILNGFVEYSKPLNGAEVFAYARSMVMNHMKKAKELNGNQVYGVGQAVVQSKAQPKAISINVDLLPEDLKAFVETLV